MLSIPTIGETIKRLTTPLFTKLSDHFVISKDTEYVRRKDQEFVALGLSASLIESG